MRSMAISFSSAAVDEGWRSGLDRPLVEARKTIGNSLNHQILPESVGSPGKKANPMRAMGTVMIPSASVDTSRSGQRRQREGG